MAITSYAARQRKREKLERNTCALADFAYRAGWSVEMLTRYLLIVGIIILALIASR